MSLSVLWKWQYAFIFREPTQRSPSRGTFLLVWKCSHFQRIYEMALNFPFTRLPHTAVVYSPFHFILDLGLLLAIFTLPWFLCIFKKSDIFAGLFKSSHKPTDLTSLSKWIRPCPNKIVLQLWVIFLGQGLISWTNALGQLADFDSIQNLDPTCNSWAIHS